MFKDYYKILDIVSDASLEEIKRAYRSQSMRWHPDKNPGTDTTDKMQDINEAYNILKDSVTRARYDAEYAKFNSAKYEQPKKETEETDYDIKDETLQEDIRAARKAAEDYVREFYASLKADSQKAAKGAWEEMKGYVIGGLIMAIVALVVRTCIGNQPQTTVQEIISTTYSDSHQPSAPSNETVALREEITNEINNIINLKNMDTNSKSTTSKTQGISWEKIEQTLIDHGCKRGNKTGSCIMPAPRHSQSAKQQQNSQNQTENNKE